MHRSWRATPERTLDPPITFKPLRPSARPQLQHHTPACARTHRVQTPTPNTPSQQHGSIISNHRVEAAGRQDEAAVGSGRGAIARAPLQGKFSVSADGNSPLRAPSTGRMQGGASARRATGTLVRGMQSITQKKLGSFVPPGAGRSLPRGQSSGCRLRRRPALWRRPRPCSPARPGGSAELSASAART